MATFKNLLKIAVLKENLEKTETGLVAWKFWDMDQYILNALTSNDLRKVRYWQVDAGPIL